MGDVSKAFREMVSRSLNSDQINAIAQEMSGRFDLSEASGFSSKIAIPSHAAAEAVISYFNSDDDLVEFFERMLQYEGKFLYDTTCRLFMKEEFIDVLEKNKWIFDPDTGRFLRDSFFLEKENFLKQIEFIDMRNRSDFSDLTGFIEKNSENLKLDDLIWSVTLRTYNFSGPGTSLVNQLVELLLRTLKLEDHSGEIYTCLKELAINAAKATYKNLFEKYKTAPEGITIRYKYHAFLEKFRREIEEHGDAGLMDLARMDDKFFDIQLKSSKNSISFWTTNYTRIIKQEKLQLLKKLDYRVYEDIIMDQDDEDPLREGAGLGLGLVILVLKKLLNDPRPLRVVFYPDLTKIGFIIPRRRLIPSAN